MDADRDGVRNAERDQAHLGVRAGLGVLLALAGCMAAVASPADALQQKLTASDGAADDIFGWSVAVDGDTLVVGAPLDDAGQGAVYVYDRTGDTWTQTAKLTASDGGIDDFLGTDVAIDGDTIVAGAPYDDLPLDPDAGSAYTFARDGAAARTETAKLTVADPVIEEHFGSSVAIDGDTIVGGAPGEFVGANDRQGAAYTFARTGLAARTETAELTASDGGSEDALGRSVAIDGDTIVAGAPYADLGPSNDQGAVYTFASTGGSRTQTAKLTTGTAEEQLGRSVAIDGDTIVAGGDGDGPGPMFARGTAYTFARSGPDRGETAELLASDGASGDLFGGAVAIAADAIVVGARFDDLPGAANGGSAYTFARAGASSRTETAKLIAPDAAAGDEFGFSAAADSGVVVVGSRYDTIDSATEQGSAWVFFAADAEPPKTKGLKGPGKVDRGAIAKFKFKSSEEDSTFRCKLDKQKFKKCKSPRKVKTAKLKARKHTFAVYAIDEAGNRDPTPAKLKFRVVAGPHGG